MASFVNALSDYLAKIEELRPLSVVRSGRGWRMVSAEEGRISWEPQEMRWEDWAGPLHQHRDTILNWPETVNLVEAVHRKTGANSHEIRGVLLDLATAFLENVPKGNRQKVIETLAKELEELFTIGLAATFRSFVSGIQVPNAMSPAPDVALRPFEPSDWPWNRDPSADMMRISLQDTTVLEIKGRMPALGQPFDPFDEKAYHWQRRLEEVLRMLRLFRVGGVVSHESRTVATTLLRISLHGSGISGPDHGSAYTYRLAGDDGEALKAHFAFLKGLPPWKLENLTPVDIALERYESAVGPARHAEEALLYTVMGFEALLRARNEASEKIAYRVALMLDLVGFEEPLRVRETVKRAYRFRNPFVHGETVGEDRMPDLKKSLLPLLDYLRASILLTMGLGISKGEYLRLLDDVLLMPDRREGLQTRLRDVAGAIRLQPHAVQ